MSLPVDPVNKAKKITLLRDLVVRVIGGGGKVWVNANGMLECLDFSTSRHFSSGTEVPFCSSLASPYVQIAYAICCKNTYGGAVI